MDLKYRSEVEGLRAVAVLAVVLFHLDVQGFGGGFVGVDIFFVISGFLITRQVRQMIDTGTFTFSNFYVRRVRRLAPAFIFTATLAFIAAVLLFSPDDLRRFSGSLIGALTGTSNIYFWRESGYFDTAAQLKPLLHTWSLSVEEQFYLVWPATLLILSRVTRSPLIIVFGVIAAGVAASVMLSDHRAAAFYLSPFRAYEFLIGATLTWLPSARRSAGAFTLAGLVLITASVAIVTSEMPFPHAIALAPCLGAALVIYGGSNGQIATLLTNKPMVWIGTISYSLYLIHWPLITFWRSSFGVNLSAIDQVTLFAASIVAAALMYRYIEKPWRKPRPRNRQFVLACVAISVVCILPAWHAMKHSGWPQRVTKTFDNSSAYAAGSVDWSQTFPAQDPIGNVVLYGDSHAKQYAPALAEFLNKRHYTMTLISLPACMALPDGITNENTGPARAECLSKLPQLESVTPKPAVVIVAYRWVKTLAAAPGESSGLNFMTEPKYMARVSVGLQKLVHTFGDKTPFIIMGNVPSARLPRGYEPCANRPISLSTCHDRFPRNDGEFFSEITDFEKFAKDNPNVTFLNPYDALCDQTWCYVVREKTLYYSDHAHLTAEGARLVIQGNESLITSALDRSKSRSASRER